MKSARYGTVTLKDVFGCAVVPRLGVALAKGKPTTLKVMDGDGGRPLLKVFQTCFPDAPPPAEGCG